MKNVILILLLLTATAFAEGAAICHPFCEGVQHGNAECIYVDLPTEMICWDGKYGLPNK
jgi:hypothetical protein